MGVTRACVLLAVLTGLAEGGGGEWHAPEGTLYVVSIGFDLMDSKFSRTDARAFADCFPASTKRSVHINGDREEVKRALRDVVASAQPQDTFVFYFAGWAGQLEDRGYHLGLKGKLTEGTRRQRIDDAIRHGISLRSLFAIMQQVRCLNRMIVLDAGEQSGLMIDEFVSFERKAGRTGSTCLIGLAGWSVEVKEVGHGWLTYVLLEGLRGAADRALDKTDRNGITTARELEAYCYARMPRVAKYSINRKHRFPRTYFRGPDFDLAPVPPEQLKKALELGELKDTAGPVIEVLEQSGKRGSEDHKRPETEEKSLLLRVKVTDLFSGVDEVSAHTLRKVEGKLTPTRQHNIVKSKDGSWKARVPLALGQNTIRISATDMLGHKTEKILRMFRKQHSVSEKDQREGKDYALLIAIDDYKDWKDLKSALRDAKAVQQSLTDTFGFQTELMKNPTKRAILLKLHEYVKRKYRKHDQLLVFFAGHGTVNKDTKLGYLCPQDAERNDELCLSLLSHMEFINTVESIPCEHILVVLDSCRGGAALRLRGSRGEDDPKADTSDAKFITTKLKRRSRKLVTSGSENQDVWDGGDGHSPFAVRILEALRSRETDARILSYLGFLTFLERAKPDPQHGDFGSSETSSHFLFIPKKSKK